MCRPILTTQESTLYCLSLAKNCRPLFCVCQIYLYFSVSVRFPSRSRIFSPKYPWRLRLRFVEIRKNQTKYMQLRKSGIEKKKMKLKREYAGKMCATVVGKSRHTKRQKLREYLHENISLQWSDFRASATHTAAIDIIICTTNSNDGNDGWVFSKIYIYLHTVPCTIYNFKYYSIQFVYNISFDDAQWQAAPRAATHVPHTNIYVYAANGRALSVIHGNGILTHHLVF